MQLLKEVAEAFWSLWGQQGYLIRAMIRDFEVKLVARVSLIKIPYIPSVIDIRHVGQYSLNFVFLTSLMRKDKRIPVR